MWSIAKEIKVQLAKTAAVHTMAKTLAAGVFYPKKIYISKPTWSLDKNSSAMDMGDKPGSNSTQKWHQIL